MKAILEDWDCFRWHSEKEKDVIVEAILDAVICDPCSLSVDGVCVPVEG